MIGPPDDYPHFLDDITMSVGAADEPLVGGYQIVQLIEVGPLVVQGPPSTVTDEEHVVLEAVDKAIDCAAPFACGPIRAFKQTFDLEQGSRRTGRRAIDGA